MFKKTNMWGASSVATTAYLSGAPEFTPVLMGFVLPGFLYRI